MDIYRTYNTTTRSLTKTANAYAGQMGDSLSTRLHFEYDDLGYLNIHQAFIVFAVYDSDNNPLVYGPTSTPSFDGLTFDIPWDVTSRITSRRLEYQLWFLAENVTWDGETWGDLDRTTVTMSAVDGIAIKPSIAPKCGCNPPFLPTAAEPGVLGWISLWQKVGLIGPVGQEIDEETGYPVLIFRTYAGEDSRVLLQNIAGLVDGKVPIELLPTSVQTVTADVAQLKTEVETASTGLLDRMTAAEGDVTALDGRLDALEATVDTPGTGLSAKVTTLQTEVEAPSTGLISKVATLQSEVEASSTGLLDRMTVAEGDITSLDGRLDAAEPKITTLQQEVETPSTGLLDRMTSAESNITSLDGRLDTVEPKVATLQNEVEDPSTGLIKQVQDLQRLGLRYEVYQSYQDLPVPGSRNVLYLVRHAGTQTDNYYDEYLWVTDGTSGVYELIGTTQFTLNITGDAYNVRLNGTAVPNASASTAGVITAAQFVQFSSRMARYEEIMALSKTGTNVIHDLGTIPASVAVYVDNSLVRCKVDVIDTNTVRLKPTSNIAQARVIISY